MRESDRDRQWRERQARVVPRAVQATLKRQENIPLTVGSRVYILTESKASHEPGVFRILEIVGDSAKIEYSKDPTLGLPWPERQGIQTVGIEYLISAIDFDRYAADFWNEDFTSSGGFDSKRLQE